MRLLSVFAVIAACRTTEIPPSDCATPPCDTDTPPTEPTTPTTTGEGPGTPEVELVPLADPALTQGEVITVTATVSDREGLSTVIGGNIRTADDQVVIVPFTQVRGVGQFEAQLGWSDIHRAIGIEFEQATLDLALSAVFFDNTGLEGRAPLSITLTCGGGSFYACEGACVDAGDDPRHCGACRSACDSDCNAGTCDFAWSACIDLQSTAQTNCAEYCGSVGEVCVDECASDDWAFNSFVRWVLADCSGGADYDFELLRCDTSDAWSTGGGTFKSAQCCCSDGAVFP